MMSTRVRSLRRRRPSGRAAGTALPDAAGLLEGKPVQLAHACPALDVGDRLERDQQVLALAFGQRRQFRPVHQLQPLHRALARQPDAGAQVLVLVGREQQHPPQRDAAFAGPRPGLDLGTDARLAVAVDVARRCQRRGLRQLVVGGRGTQLLEVGEALEDRAHGIPGTLRDAGGGRHRRRRIVPHQREEGLDDQLLRSLATQAATVDPGTTGI